MISIGEFKIMEHWIPGVQGSFIRVEGPDISSDKKQRNIIMFIPIEEQSIIVGALHAIIDDPSDSFVRVIDPQFKVTLSVVHDDSISKNNGSTEINYLLQLRTDSVWIRTTTTKDKLDIAVANFSHIIDDNLKYGKIVMR